MIFNELIMQDGISLVRTLCVHKTMFVVPTDVWNCLSSEPMELQ